MVRTTACPFSYFIVPWPWAACRPVCLIVCGGCEGESLAGKIVIDEFSPNTPTNLTNLSPSLTSLLQATTTIMVAMYR
jgi:hypothetical protein